MTGAKSRFIFTLMIFSLSPIILGVEAGEESTPATHFEQHNEEVDKLSKLLEIPEVKGIYDQCSKIDGVDMSKCLWQGNATANIVGIQNNEQVMEKIQSSLDDTLKDNDINQYESVTAISLKKETSLAQKSLEDFYLNKMSSEIFGEFDASGKPVDGKHKIIDHTKFNTIYQNQLTKNILTGISSFCIEAKVVNQFPLISSKKSNRDSQRKTNLTSLQGAGNGTLTGAEITSSQWKDCFVNAQYLCHGGNKTEMVDNNGVKEPKRDSAGNVVKNNAKHYLSITTCSSTSDCDAKSTAAKKKECRDEKKKCDQKQKDYKYTQQRACELTNFLKVTRQNLKTVEKISEGYNQAFSKGGVAIQGTDAKQQSNTEQVSLDKKVDKLTATTSNEFINESGFSDATTNDLAELEKCIQKDPTTGVITYTGDENACKKFLNTDREASEKLKAEHMLRLKGLSAKVSKLDATSDDTKELESYLSDQGLSNDEIGNQLAATDIKKLKQQIIDRYDAEKEQLIKSLNEQIEDKTSTNNGSLDLAAGAASRDLQKLEKIHSELSSKTENYAQLIHFNNVVSGFLDIEEKGGKKKRNTASIKRELENSAFSNDNLGKNQILGAAGYQDQNEKVEESLSGVEISDNDGEQGATLGVDKINTVILKYDTEE